MSMLNFYKRLATTGDCLNWNTILLLNIELRLNRVQCNADVGTNKILIMFDIE